MTMNGETRRPTWSGNRTGTRLHEQLDVGGRDGNALETPFGDIRLQDTAEKEEVRRGRRRRRIAVVVVRCLSSSV